MSASASTVAFVATSFAAAPVPVTATAFAPAESFRAPTNAYSRVPVAPTVRTLPASPAAVTVVIPVPPFACAIVVPFHVPVVIVPTVVMEA
ncbi:hypothetical protein D3C86_1438030 [compost metagenome]